MNNSIMILLLINFAYALSIPSVVDSSFDMTFNEQMKPLDQQVLVDLGIQSQSSLFANKNLMGGTNTTTGGTNSTQESRSGLRCVDGKVYAPVYGKFKWVAKKTFSNENGTNVDLEWNEKTTLVVSTSVDELTRVASSNTDTHKGSVSLEVTGNFMFGSVTGKAGYEYVGTKIAEIARESKSSTTVTRTYEEHIKLKLSPGTTLYLYEGILEFPGKTFSAMDLRVTGKPLPEQDEVFMLMPVVAGGTHSCEDRSMTVEMWKDPGFNGSSWPVPSQILPKTNYEWENKGYCDSQFPGLIYEFSSAKWTQPNRFKQICFYEQSNCTGEIKVCNSGTEIADFAPFGLDNKVYSYGVEFQ